MRRALVLAVLALLALAPAASAGRLDDVARALERQSVYVSPDLRDAIPPATADALRAAIARARPALDIRVAALVERPEDESGGEARRILYGISDRLPKRPRVLVLIGDTGTADVLALGVRRDIPYGLDGAYATGRETAAQRRDRLVRFIDAIAATPPGATYPPSRPEGPPTPLDPPPSDSGDDRNNALLGVAFFWVIAVIIGASLAIKRHHLRRLGTRRRT